MSQHRTTRHRLDPRASTEMLRTVAVYLKAIRESGRLRIETPGGSLDLLDAEFDDGRLVLTVIEPAEPGCRS
jgi:hypothetical protein